MLGMTELLSGAGCCSGEEVRLSGACVTVLPQTHRHTSSRNAQKLQHMSIVEPPVVIWFGVVKYGASDQHEEGNEVAQC